MRETIGDNVGNGSGLSSCVARLEDMPDARSVQQRRIRSQQDDSIYTFVGRAVATVPKLSVARIYKDLP